jgi:uncharacterized protein (TIGR01777 family)
VLILTRNPHADNQYQWDGQTLGDWVSELGNADVLINLTGKSVDCRYTKKNKREILESRILSTSVLEEALHKLWNPPSIWLNASSATIYDHSELHFNTEAAGVIGNDFSMGVCKAWEKEFFKNTSNRIRKVALRTAIVLGNEGGAFPKLYHISKMGLGGNQGNGKQYMSWIHSLDFCRAVEFIIQNEKISGVINLVTPGAVMNRKFMELLAQYTHPFIRIAIPKLILEIGAFIIRTETELLLKSRKVYPDRLLKNGFDFYYPTLREAMNDIVKTKDKMNYRSINR